MSKTSTKLAALVANREPDTHRVYRCGDTASAWALPDGSTIVRDTSSVKPTRYWRTHATLAK